jgi:predicted nucleotidyltransferase
LTLSAFLALEDELAKLTAQRADLVSTRALKPHIGRRVRAEAMTV